MLLLPNGDARRLSKAWTLGGLRHRFHPARTAISADSLPFPFSEADEEPEAESHSIRSLASTLRVRQARWRTNRPLPSPSTAPGLGRDRSQLRSPGIGVVTTENSSFAKLLPSIYCANAGTVHFPAVRIRGSSARRRSYAPIACPLGLAMTPTPRGSHRTPHPVAPC
jgi:hypothetical protein